MARISKILYATDLSELSTCALEYAVYLARQCPAKLHCLNVVDESYQYWPTFETSPIPTGPPTEELLAAARKELKAFLAERVPEDVPVTAEVGHGRPFAEIIRYAGKNEMDLIVLGTHGRSALRQVLMGSVADKVVRKSPCPVLTVRHPEHGFEMP